MVEFEQVSFQYGKDSGNGVQNVNMKLQKGECIVLAGKSGCGKTTITRLINGLAPHFYEGELQGKICIGGEEIKEKKPGGLAASVGSVFQNPRSQFFNIDTTDEIAFGCENTGIPREEIWNRVRSIASLMKIEHLLDRDIFNLSGGEKQQIAIASAHALLPELFVLDEPSANLDAQATEKLGALLATLQAAGKTILIAEHRLYYLMDIANRILYMDSGNIVEEWRPEEFKLLPEAGRTALGLRAPSLDVLCPTTKRHTLNIATAVHVHEASAAYKKQEPVLEQVSLEARAGECIALVGKNGAGKSTLAKLLCGLKKETGGVIHFQERSIPYRKRPQKAYLVMQDSNYQLFTESVETELLLGMPDTAGREARAAGILDSLSLSELKERHPASLSGGQKQRLSIAVSIMRDADIIVLDEPTSGLDYDNMDRVCGIVEDLRTRGKTVFIITHDYEFLLRTCTRVIEIADRKIVRDYALCDKNLHMLRAFFLPAKKEEENVFAQ